MEQILLAYGLSKETITAIIMLYKNTKKMICSPDDHTDFCDIEDTLASYGSYKYY